MKEKQTIDNPEEPDYYWENGFLVFTEAYHLKRGHCCKNDCRHCPYKKSKSSKNPE